MPLYSVITQQNVDFSAVPTAEINTFKWAEGYSQRAFGQLVLVENKGFALKMTAFESKPKAVYSNYGDAVYEDSCLEFFVRFNNNSPLYMNFEMNSAGAFLAAVRTERKNKTGIHTLATLPSVKAQQLSDRWSVEAFYSFAFIEALFGKCVFDKGGTFFGNFYKCGDKTEQPHFGMWAPIDSEKPDFHRPDCFGQFIIE